MSHRYRVSLLVLITLAGIIFAWGAVRAASLVQRAPSVPPTPPAAPTPQALFDDTADRLQPSDPQIQRQREPSSPGAPNISFIDSPSATCYLPVSGTDTCYITWDYLYVTAGASQYMISMTIGIDNHLSAYFGGFFQTFIYIPGDMLSPGFRVACGTPGSGGNPYLGKQYSYTIRARETSGLSAANYGAVTCPADQVALHSLGLSGPTSGNTGVEYTFTASADPITTTLPVTYVWEVTGYPAITETNGIGVSQAFTWSTLGAKTIKVTASNPVSSLTQTHTITIYAITPISALILSGSTSGPTSVDYTFNASVTPISATLPVTYTWEVTGYPAISDTNGLSINRSFSWLTPGLKSIQVTARNPVNSLTQSRFLAIGGDQVLYQLFLPLMKK